MIDNHFHRVYHIILLFLISTMTFVIALLFFQYQFLCTQVQELIVLRQQYYEDIEAQQRGEKRNVDFSDENNTMTVEEMFIAQANDDPDDDDEYIDESFVAINREQDYLKQSTVSYLQAQELDDLMTKIDMNQWSDYTEQKPILPKQHTNPHTQQRVCVTKSTKDYEFSWPIERDKFWLSSLYGPRKRINGTWGFHHGIDMAAVKGTLVKSARAGKVIEARFQSGYGNTVLIEHTPHIKTRYAHLHTIRVHVGQVIQSGVIIGTVGETGFIRKKGKDGSHLHFEVYESGKRINPLQCLPRAC